MLFRETEYGAPISIYHSLENTKKHNFKTLFLMTYVRSKQSQKNCCSQKSLAFQNKIVMES